MFGDDSVKVSDGQITAFDRILEAVEIRRAASAILICASCSITASCGHQRILNRRRDGKRN